MSARNVDYPDRRRLQIGVAAIDARRSMRKTAERFPAVAAETGRRRGEKTHPRRRQLPDRWRHPPVAAVRGGQELYAARRDPVGRRAGDPEFRPPVDPDLCPRPPAQFGAVWHDGRRAAVCGRRQGGQAEAQVICLHGDGSFGQNAMELDTAVRHKLPLLCVISLNGGWTADPERNKPGRDLGYTRYDKMAEALGLLCRICRTAGGNPPGPAARLEKGRGRHGRLCQRQDRLPRPRHDRALFQPRNLTSALPLTLPCSRGRVKVGQAV